MCGLQALGRQSTPLKQSSLSIEQLNTCDDPLQGPLCSGIICSPCGEQAFLSKPIAFALIAASPTM